MKDGIIKGNGNSRWLKSSKDFLTKYPNYEAFAQALIEGTLPVDFNGINAEGWTQIGTALNKANLLTDETAGLIGLGGDPTPNDAFAALSTLLGGAAKIQTGSYEGTGTYGAQNPCSITFDFPPQIFFVECGVWTGASCVLWAIRDIRDVLTPLTLTTTSSSSFVYLTWNSDNSVKWFLNSGPASYQMNTQNATYRWIAIG